MGIGTKLMAAVKIIRVACALHNMGRVLNDDAVEEGPDEDGDDQDGAEAAGQGQEDTLGEAGMRARGKKFRDDLVAQFFP